MSGNDDLGQMPAWFVFTALSPHPVAPGSNEYAIGRPYLDKAVLNLQAANASPCAVVALNGKPLPRTFLRHDGTGARVGEGDLAGATGRDELGAHFGTGQARRLCGNRERRSRFVDLQFAMWTVGISGIEEAAGQSWDGAASRGGVAMRR
nr:glycoside hydrolase domain-containing protein [Massilia soli]